MAMYLVTGGAGFIGSHLVEALVADGHRVRVLDNLSTGNIRNLEKVASRITFIEADIADRKSVKSCIGGVSGVFHLAACSSVQQSIENPELNQRSGEIATLQLLQEAVAHSVKRLVYSSSASVYGDLPESPLREDLSPSPQSPYAVSKLACEQYCRLFAANHPRLDTVSLRYFNVLGTRQTPSNPYSGVISIFLEHVRQRVPPVIYGNGKQTRDFISVHDVVRANMAAMAHPAAPLRGECLNVATGRSVTILEVWNRLSEIGKVRLEPRFKARRPGDILHSAASIDKIRKTLGFSPKKKFEDALGDLAESVLGAATTK